MKIMKTLLPGTLSINAFKPSYSDVLLKGVQTVLQCNFLLNSWYPVQCRILENWMWAISGSCHVTTVLWIL